MNERRRRSDDASGPPLRARDRGSSGTPRRPGPPGRHRVAALVGFVLLTAALAGVLSVASSLPADEPLALGVVELVDAPGPLPARRCTLAPHDDRPEEIRAAHIAGAWVSSEAVTSCPAAFDRRQVRFVGEVIGEALARNGGSWVLVNDDAYALEVGPLGSHRELRGTNRGLSVWLPDPLPDRLSTFGRPGHLGDVVEVEGTILRDDPDDGGGLTLRAERLRVVRSGAAVPQQLHLPTIALALVTSLLAVAAFAGRRRSQRVGPPRHAA